MRRLTAILIVLFFCWNTPKGIGQNNAIDSLILELYSFQIKEDTSSFYAAGLFPSQRKQSRKWVEDDNIFFTSLIVLTLQRYHPYLSSENALKVDSVIEAAIINYPDYCQKEKHYTCNFWVPTKGRHFPNSRFSENPHYALPDDFDDTSLLLATGNFSTEDQLDAAKKMILHKNTKSSQIHSTFKRYRNYEAYSTWFGKNMPVDFDICVHANLLMWKAIKKLNWNVTDSATFNLIQAIVLNDDHLKNPQIVAPHYQHKEVVLYHLARWLSIDSTPVTAPLKEKVKADLLEALHTSNTPWNSLLLSNGLMMLGDYQEEITEVPINDLYYFIANLTSVNRLYIRVLTEHIGLTELPYRCKAFEIALLFEHEMLRRLGNKQ